MLGVIVNKTETYELISYQDSEDDNEAVTTWSSRKRKKDEAEIAKEIS